MAGIERWSSACYWDAWTALSGDATTQLSARGEEDLYYLEFLSLLLCLVAFTLPSK